MATCAEDRRPTAPDTRVPVASPTQSSGAITHTLLTAGNNTVNKKVYTTAAIAPAANALITVAVLGHNSSSTPPIPTLSGGGMTTWDVVATITFDTGTLPLKRMTLFRALSVAPGSGPLTITSSKTLSHTQWIVSQWDGVDQSGANGDGAITQTSSMRGDAVSGLTVPLAAFGNANNVAYGVFGLRSKVLAVTPGAGFTEISEQPSGESTPGDLQAEWAINVSVIDATWTARNAGALGVEIKTGAAEPLPVAAVVVNPAAASVGVGATLQVTATPTDINGHPLNDRAVTWASSDEAVATVTASGLVTGVAPGSATIAATSEGQSGTAAVTVGAPVASVSVTPTSADVQVGATQQLSATPQDASGEALSGRVVTWATNDVAVATVSETGLVRGVGAGPATITATSEGQSGSSAVTVTPVPVAAVDVTPAAAGVSVGRTVQLTATPKDAAGNPLIGRAVTWLSSNEGVATVTGNGLVTGVGLGTTTITATSEGHAGTSEVTVTAPVVVLVGAGDIAVCGQPHDEATAALLDTLPGTVFAAGDNAYDNGTLQEYATCYDPSWGRQKARTRPVAGNHDYNTADAAGYYGYFGTAAGDPAQGYYSFDLGDWHVVVLNSNIARDVGSAQEQWLRADLAASTQQCQIAIWHHPLFTNQISRTTNTSMKPVWDVLYVAGAELVVNAHDHSYQRYAPQTPKGVRDPAGMRQITVGTGGASLSGFGPEASNVEVRNNVTYGVLQLTLRTSTYEWRFVPAAGQTFTDAGSGTCQGPRPPPPNQAPVARPGGPYRAEAVLTFDGSASADPDNDTPLTYAWDFGDGTTGTGAAPSHSYAADAEYTVTLVVTDALGAASAPATTTATITNVAPTVNAGPDAFIAPEATFNLNASFSDPGVNDGPWTYVIDWGDAATESGSVATQVASIAAGHAYAAVGQYVVQVTVTDKDAGAGSDALTVTVTVTGSVPATITHTLLTAGSDPVNQKIYTTAALTPAPNTLITVAVMGHQSTSATPSPTLSGGGMTTWTEVASLSFDTGTLPHKRLTIFRAMSPAPGSGPLTITFSTAVSNCQWIVSQWGGVDQSGANGAGAIAQTGSVRGDAVTGLTVPLAAFGGANNVAYGVFGVTSKVLAVTPGAGFTAIADQPDGESPFADLAAEWAVNASLIAASWAQVLNAGALGVEIKAGAAGP